MQAAMSPKNSGTAVALGKPAQSAVAAAAQRPALQHSVSVPDGSVDRPHSRSGLEGISSPRSVPAMPAVNSPAPPKSNMTVSGGPASVGATSQSNPATPSNLVLPNSVQGPVVNDINKQYSGIGMSTEMNKFDASSFDGVSY